jgi:hypothetical protein
MSANPGALPGWFHRHSSGDAHSDPNKKMEDSMGDSTSHSTTGGQEDQTPVVVWEAANRMEAEIVAGRLNSQNIPTIITGESLGTIYGLTTGSLASANVLVPAALAEKALAILSDSEEWDENEPAEGDA